MNRRDFIGGCAAGAVAAGLPAVKKVSPKMNRSAEEIGDRLLSAIDPETPRNFTIVLMRGGRQEIFEYDSCVIDTPRIVSQP